MISGTCVAAHDSAATWMMNIFTGSPLLLSLMSTVASLPFFLFTLPAGALADKVDRQKLVCTVNVCLAATTFALAVLGWLHLLNPYLILGCVFFIGVGFAINAPAWTSIVPQIVSDAELPSAATLSGLQFNISGIIGPALGGLLVPLAGANFVFALKCRLLPLGCGGNSAMETTNPLAKVHQNRSGCPYRSGKQKQDRSNNFRLVLFGVVNFPLRMGIRSNLRLTNTYSRRRRPDCFP